MQRARFENRVVMRHKKPRHVRVKVIESHMLCPNGHHETVEVVQELRKRIARRGRAF